MPTARKGAAVAEAHSKSGNFPGRIPFFRMKDGDPAVFIRMIDDHPDWLSADIHMAIPTKPAPENYQGKWPSMMSGTCQNSDMFRIFDDAGNMLEGFEAGMGECWIHANLGGQKDKFGKAKSESVAMVHALCVLREPIMSPDGGIVGMRDKTEEWTDPKTKEKRQVPAFRLLQQRWGNFFSPMKAGAFLDNCCVNKDYRVERSGNDYHITPLPPTPDHAPGTPSWATYEKAIELMKVDVLGSIAEQGSVKYYQRFFIPGDHGEAEEEGGGYAAEPESGAEVSEDELAAFKQRLLQGGSSS